MVINKERKQKRTKMLSSKKKLNEEKEIPVNNLSKIAESRLRGENCARTVRKQAIDREVGSRVLLQVRLKKFVK